MKFKILFLLSLSIFALSAKADNIIDVKIKVININTADISITYPTPYQESTFNILPSQMEDLTGLSGTYKLLSVTTGTGEKREFADFQDNLSDAMVYTKPTDTSIIVTYRITSGLKQANIGSFKYPLILGSNYPSQARLTITYPTNLSVLAYPNSEQVTGITPRIINTMIYNPVSAGGYYNAELFVLVQKKVGTYSQKNIGSRFILSAPKAKLTESSKLLNSLSPALPVYKELLGFDLPKKIVVAVVPIRYKVKQYETEAVQMSKNVILLDEKLFTKDTPELFRKKVLAHELAHTVINTAGLFRNEKYFARWVDEGISVFTEQYISDMYFHKNIKPAEAKKMSLGYWKMTRKEADAGYRKYFDYGFSAKEDFEKIQSTYSHAGLIFYNLYARDKTLIPRLMTSLKGLLTAGDCEMCDTDNVIQIISSMNGMKRDEIIYPFDEELKKSLDFTDPISNIIFSDI